MKLKPTEMSGDVRQLIDERHQAEQRGHYEPLGRLLVLETAHGVIQFPIENGEGAGPDLAHSVCGDDDCDANDNSLLVLGPWRGLPPLRRNSTTPCPKCRHACDICDGSGKKVCEGLDCGGRGYVLGPLLLCPGPGCRKESGQYKPDCATCATSPVRGQIQEQLECPTCKGFRVNGGVSLMICSRCRGTGKFSTGRINGSLDWQLPKCKACDGTTFKGTWVAQDLAKFTNAALGIGVPKKSGPRVKPTFVSSKQTLVLGPIHSFTVDAFGARRMRVFDVGQDSAGDYLQLLVPANGRQRPQKAYLVGGVVRERAAQGAA